ncbi:MAG: peptidylprolyl isomerase [Spirochaetes bacterium]|nr:peptidylprolyl isomerase [Spirochaetota bacterium]
MKKYLFLILFAVIFPWNIFSQEVIDRGRRVASVNLTESAAITRGELDRTLTMIRQTIPPGSRQPTEMEVLEMMIGEILLKQGAERARIRITDSAIMTSTRRQIEAQLGPAAAGLTNEQVQEIVSRETGVPWATYLERTRDAMQLREFVRRAKSANFSNVPSLTDSEITRFYHENTGRFLIPKTVRFDHILVDTRMLTAEQHNLARERALSYERDLRTGARTFDQIVINSDDTRTKYNGGNFGFLRINDVQQRRIHGEEFFNNVFELRQGQISGIIRSNVGFHIVRMNEVIEPRILALTDRINPDVNITVRDLIEENLMEMRQAEVFRRSVEELVQQLREEADVRIFL